MEIQYVKQMCQCDIVLVVKKCVPSIVITNQMKWINHFIGAAVNAIRKVAIIIKEVVHSRYQFLVCKLLY